jgi:GntR family transcriptional regulator, arabinose operon transcriptional repressor
MSVLKIHGALAPYQQIRSQLKAEILKNMSPGDKLPPERELAARFGVNRGTVCHAIDLLVEEGLLVRRIRRGTFVASADNSHRPKVTKSVGLVLPHIAEVFPAGTIRSIIKGLKESGYSTVLFDSANSVEEEAKELERLLQEGLDGAIVMPVIHRENSATFARLVSLGFPIVFLDRPPVSLECDLVTSDNFWGAYELTSRLIERGHRRIAHFTWFGDFPCLPIDERRRGYEQALIDHGIEPDIGLIYPPTPVRVESEVYKASLAYLRHGDDPVTAVFAMSDNFTAATINACVALGLRIPEDVEVAGFVDGVQRVGPQIPLLRAAQKQTEIGRQAAELLIKRIQGSGPPGPQSIMIRPEILDWAKDKKAGA